MPNPVVHHKGDPDHRALQIRCEVCNICAWAHPKQSGRCLYGGPFEGYNEPAVTKEEAR